MRRKGRRKKRKTFLTAFFLLLNRYNYIFQNYPFYTVSGVTFYYTLKTG